MRLSQPGMGLLGRAVESTGPPTHSRSFAALAGYNEQGMVSFYVNIIAATAYYAKICSHMSGIISVSLPPRERERERDLPAPGSARPQAGGVVGEGTLC